jgi:hypothetical protein
MASFVGQAFVFYSGVTCQWPLLKRERRAQAPGDRDNRASGPHLSAKNSLRNELVGKASIRLQRM